MNERLCQNCHKPVPINANFCVSCGYKLPQNDAHIEESSKSSKNNIVQNNQTKQVYDNNPPVLQNHFEGGSNKRKPNWVIILLVALIIGLGITLILALSQKFAARGQPSLNSDTNTNQILPRATNESTEIKPTPYNNNSSKIAGITQTPKTNDFEIIQIWKVGDPHDGDTPPKTIPNSINALFRQENYLIEVTTFPAKNFDQIFLNAFNNNMAPDILVFNNWGIIDGITTDLGTFTGIGIDEVKERMIIVESSLDDLLDYGYGGGWVAVFSSSNKYLHLKSIILEENKCDLSHEEGNYGSIPQELVNDVVIALYRKDKERLSKLSNNQFFDIYSLEDMDLEGVIQNTIICSSWGNEQLLFLHVIVGFDGYYRFGSDSLLLVFERINQEDWKLVTSNLYPEIIATLYENNLALTSSELNVTLKIPELISPPDNSDAYRFVNNPIDLVWTETGPDTVAYLVDWQYCVSDLCSFGQLVYVSPTQGRMGTISIDVPFGAGQQPHRWRIWAISKSGSLEITNFRNINFLN